MLPLFLLLEIVSKEATIISILGVLMAIAGALTVARLKLVLVYSSVLGIS